MSFSAKVALSFDQPSKVARWQSVGLAIWRDREAQPEESGCRPGQDPEGMRAETGDSEISPTGTGLSEPRGPPDRRKARPFFGCSCTLPPTDGKLKNHDGDFPVAMLPQRDLPPHLPHQPTAPKPPKQPLRDFPEVWILRLGVTPLIKVGSSRKVAAQLTGTDPPTKGTSQLPSWSWVS